MFMIKYFFSDGIFNDFADQDFKLFKMLLNSKYGCLHGSVLSFGLIALV